MSTKKNISNNIKLLMPQKGIKAWSELAKQCGLTVPAMQRLVNQATESPGINSLKAIADFFDISVDELISPDLADKSMAAEAGGHLLPLFDDARINKWLRLQNDIEARKNDNVVSTDVQVSNNSFAYKVLDGNLSPVIPENSILIVDAQREVKNKDYVLLKYPSFDNVIIRQILTDGLNKYTIPIISAYGNVPHEKLSPDARVIGVVVKMSIYFR